MLTKKLLFMKLPITFCMVITFSISSCAQQQNKPEPTIQKEQTQPVATQKIKIPL